MYNTTRLLEYTDRLLEYTDRLLEYAYVSSNVNE